MCASHDLPLPPAVDGDLRRTERRSGPLAYYVAGEGPPMLLVHSINAAGSTYEVRPIFERMRQHYTVYAVDLPGFGFSDRSARPYDVRLYVDAIHDMLDVLAEDRPGEPPHALALSLSSEFLARAAVEAPDRARSVALVTPTGFTKDSDRLRQAGQTKEIAGMHGVLTKGPWRRPLYDLLTTKRSIRYFLQRTYGSKEVHEDMVEYDYLTTHQPGAERAPYAFLSGRLFSKDVRDVYEALAGPVWLAHGTRGDFKDFSGAGWTRERDEWSVDAFDSGALPHYEVPQAFFRAYERFLARVTG